ncbi:MAG: S8 family serine peptidase [Thermoanaerobaculia bacterium]
MGQVCRGGWAREPRYHPDSSIRTYRAGYAGHDVGPGQDRPGEYRRTEDKWGLLVLLDRSGVRIYVVDTGVLSNHPDLDGRVDPAPSLKSTLLAMNIPEVNFLNYGQCWERTAGTVTTPGASHGTAVAGVVAGSTFGVAKSATVVDARAFGCSGNQQSVSVIITALNWIPMDPNRGISARVVNCSWTYLYVPSVTAAVDSLVTNYGMTVVVAAGNYNDDATWYSPAASTQAITVGGLQQGADKRRLRIATTARRSGGVKP